MTEYIRQKQMVIFFKASHEEMMSVLGGRIQTRLPQGLVECVCSLWGWQTVKLVPHSMNQRGQCSTHTPLSLSISLPGSLMSFCQGAFSGVGADFCLLWQAKGAGELKSPTADPVQSLSSDCPESVYIYPDSLFTWYHRDTSEEYVLHRFYTGSQSSPRGLSSSFPQ